MRTRKPVLYLLLFALFLFLGKGASATVIYNPRYPVYTSELKSVIYYDEKNKTETIISSTTFRGSARNFGLLIPVPSKPSVEVARGDLFTSLNQLTQPVYEPHMGRGPLLPMMGVSKIEDAPQSGVKILETKNVDVYTVSVIEAKDREELTKWLSENLYFIPTNANFVMSEYVNDGYYFVAAKINTEALGPFVEGQLREGHTNPLKITFSSDSIVLPLKLTGATSYAGANNVIDYDDFDDYDGFNPLKTFPQPPPARQTTQSTKYAPTHYTYYPPYTPQTMTLVLYIFSNHKKQAPGFYTAYAGYLSESKIEKLSTLKDSKPWVDANGRKYLTKLTRSMSTSEMNNDPIFQDADNNAPVGTGGFYLEKPLRLFLVVLVPITAEIAFLYYFLKRRKQ